ncbi:MAG: hypothetical protein JWR44_3625, partial [Hymenobacter sp.]|nr:hypothetical protein [Hymenobacter sp.]
MPPLTPATPVFYYGLLIGCLVLGGGLAALAWRRPRRRQRGPRALAGLVAAMALWFIAFPPLHRLPSAKAEAILLTDGYQPDTLRQLLRRVGAGTPVWHYGTTATPAKARALASLLNLAEQRPALRRVHILGQGLPADELPLLANLTVKYHPGAPFSGFKSAFWNSKVVLSERLQVEGTMALPKSEGAAWVCLRAAGAVRDSVAVSAGGGPFRLGYQPKTAGLALGQLLLRRAGKMLAAEPVPFEVTTLALPAVLLLTATPSFEFKYLKNHLAEAHYPVALRTTVSRGLVQTDFVNQPAVGLGRLTPALLARYSVLIVDAATLAAFAPAEAQALQAALSAGRLGVVVVADAAPLPRNAPARADFAVQPRSAAQSVPNLLVWTDAPGSARAALPAQLAPAPNLRALVTGPGGALAVAQRRVGLGFAVVSVIPETFHWGLQGQSEVYASFWNRLLTAAVPAAAASAWQVGTRWARPGR